MNWNGTFAECRNWTFLNQTSKAKKDEEEMIRCDYSRSRHAQTEESKKIEKKIDNRSV
jgi:hypothetical protein